MSKANDRPSDDKMRDHYDFSGGVRGKYAKNYAKGGNVVVLDPDSARLRRMLIQARVAPGRRGPISFTSTRTAHDSDRKR